MMGFILNLGFMISSMGYGHFINVCSNGVYATNRVRRTWCGPRSPTTTKQPAIL